MKKPILISTVVILLSPWLWRVLSRDFLMGLLTLTVSIIFFLFFSSVKPKISFKLLLFVTTIMIITSIKQGFYENILNISALEIQQFHKRHEFYGQGLGKLYRNRIALSYFENYFPVFTKLRNNFSENLDPNLYFFANHPRERVGVQEFEKFLPIFLPFFVVGFLHIIQKPKYKLLIYTVIMLITSAFISPKYQFGPVLIFPIICYLISIGIIISVGFIQVLLRK